MESVDNKMMILSFPITDGQKENITADNIVKSVGPRPDSNPLAAQVKGGRTNTFHHSMVIGHATTVCFTVNWRAVVSLGRNS